MNEEYKQQVYKRWIELGRPWFDIDPKKEPTYAERQIILEMKKRENTMLNQSKQRQRPKNEVKALHRLLTDGTNY